MLLCCRIDGFQHFRVHPIVRIYKSKVFSRRTGYPVVAGISQPAVRFIQHPYPCIILIGTGDFQRSIRRCIVYQQYFYILQCLGQYSLHTGPSMLLHYKPVQSHWLSANKSPPFRLLKHQEIQGCAASLPSNRIVLLQTYALVRYNPAVYGSAQQMRSTVPYLQEYRHWALGERKVPFQ